jgi:hypothetical protein
MIAATNLAPVSKLIVCFAPLEDVAAKSSVFVLLQTAFCAASDADAAAAACCRAMIFHSLLLDHGQASHAMFATGCQQAL